MPGYFMAQWPAFQWYGSQQPDRCTQILKVFEFWQWMWFQPWSPWLGWIVLAADFFSFCLASWWSPVKWWWGSAWATSSTTIMGHCRITFPMECWLSFVSMWPILHGHGVRLLTLLVLLLLLSLIHHSWYGIALLWLTTWYEHGNYIIYLNCLQNGRFHIVGPLGWLVPAEIQPAEIRTAGMAVATSTNMLFTFIIGQCFLSMLCNMRYGW